MERFFYGLAMATIAASVGLVLLVIFWMMYPYSVDNYLVWTHDKNPVINKTLKPGDTIKWQVDMEIKRPATVKTSRILKSRKQGCDFFILDTTVMNMIPGHRQYINTSYRVPEGTTPCSYYIELTNTLEVNPIREIHFIRETEEFNVI